MKRLILIVLAIVTFCSGCIKEETTMLEAWVYNQIDYPITILFYNNGVVANKDTVHIAPKDSFKMGSEADLGERTTPGFYSDYNCDSAIVIFDNKYQVVHYVNDTVDLADKHYLFESTRNLGNPLSYEFSRIKSKKGYYTNMHKYTFTEADYEFAKD